LGLEQVDHDHIALAAALLGVVDAANHK
jgi:hypothetical protein